MPCGPLSFFSPPAMHDQNPIFNNTHTYHTHLHIHTHTHSNTHNTKYTQCTHNTHIHHIYTYTTTQHTKRTTPTHAGSGIISNDALTTGRLLFVSLAYGMVLSSLFSLLSSLFSLLSSLLSRLPFLFSVFSFLSSFFGSSLSLLALPLIPGSTFSMLVSVLVSMSMAGLRRDLVQSILRHSGEAEGT